MINRFLIFISMVLLVKQSGAQLHANTAHQPAFELIWTKHLFEAAVVNQGLLNLAKENRIAQIAIYSSSDAILPYHRIHFNPNGTLNRIVRHDKDSSMYTNDALGRIQRVTTIDRDEAFSGIKTYYYEGSSANPRYHETTSLSPTDSSQVYQTLYQYTQKGQFIAKYEANSKRRDRPKIKYDRSGNVTRMNFGRRNFYAVFSYDEMGNRTRAVYTSYPEKKVSSTIDYLYNGNGQLIHYKIEPGPAMEDQRYNALAVDLAISYHKGFVKCGDLYDVYYNEKGLQTKIVKHGTARRHPRDEVKLIKYTYYE